MNRARLIASLVVLALLLPASAEAARLRFGGTRTSDVSPASGRGSSVAIVPGIGRSSRPAAVENGAPDRVPFPPASAAAPTLLRLTVNANSADSKVWCRSEIVIGGFCVVN